MLTILLHQLREHVTSLRVQLSLLLVLAFFGVNGTIYAWRLEKLPEIEAGLAADMERRYDTVQTVQEAVSRWYRIQNRAVGTEFMAEGGFDWLWGAFWFSPSSGTPRWWYLARDVNFHMSPFENTDWVLIVRVVLSFLCIVLAYDGISGEAQRGTLRQVLANPLSRGRVLLGKYLAHLVVIVAVTVTGTVLSLLILSLHGVLDVSAGMVRGYVVFLAGTVVYVSLYLFLSLAVSALTRTSVASLVLLTLMWAILTVIIPQTSYLVAVQSVHQPERWWQAAQNLQEETWESLNASGLAPRDRDLAAADGFAVERQVARELGELEKAQRRATQQALDRQMQRYQVARSLNLLSPGYAFQYAVEALLGTGVAKRQNFHGQALDYRETVRDFLRGRDAADGDSPHVLFMPEYMSEAPLDGDDIPRFQERPLAFGEGLPYGMAALIVLLVELLAAFLLALWAVNRADVTGYAVSQD